MRLLAGVGLLLLTAYFVLWCACDWLRERFV